MRAANADTNVKSPVLFVSRHRFGIFSAVSLVILVIASWVFVVADGGGSAGPFSPTAWSRAADFLGDLLGIGSSRTPAFFEWESWRAALGMARETLAMSVLAAGLAAAGALITVPFAAANLTHGDQAPFGSVPGRAIFLVTRSVYIMTRAVPELIWAFLIIFIVAPGVLAGALALAIHNFGVMGRLAAEVVEDIDPGPARALRSSGAGNLQILFYGVLPQALPQFMTFLLYRWEVIIRTTAVVGFVAAAGLGYQFRLDMAFFRYTDVALLLFVYVLLVWGVDIISAGLRRLAR